RTSDPRRQRNDRRPPRGAASVVGRGAVLPLLAHVPGDRLAAEVPGDHQDRLAQVPHREFAVGYLGETVLVVSGDFGGETVAWDVGEKREYGPAADNAGSTARGPAVVSLPARVGSA